MGVSTAFPQDGALFLYLNGGKLAKGVEKSSTGHPEISTQMAENW